VPDLGRIAIIAISNEGMAGIVPEELGLIYSYGFTYHNNNSCTDSPGIKEPVEKIVRFKDYNGTTHYGYASVDKTKLTDYSYELSQWGCAPVYNGTTKGLPLTIVNSLPFTTPISFPIKYQQIADTKINIKPPK
jgi:hypothetical protein